LCDGLDRDGEQPSAQRLRLVVVLGFLDREPLEEHAHVRVAAASASANDGVFASW